MLNIMTTALRSINRPRRPLNILCQPVHEGYSSLLSYTGHNFYMLSGDGCKQWDHVTRPIPPNFYHLKKPNHLPNDIHIDLLFSQERFGNLQRFLDFRNKTGLPVIHMDHALPSPGWSKKQIEASKTLRADTHVFVTEMSRQAWGGGPNDSVIRYGIDDTLFQGWVGDQPTEAPRGISVVNHIAQRDVFCGWGMFQQIASKVPVELVGENPGLSESAKDVNDLVSKLQKARFYLNTSQWSTFPLTIAEALMVGCPVVTTAKQEIPLIVSHGYNGFLSDNPEDLIKYCKLLLEDKTLAQEMSKNARASALNFFSMQTFVQKWNDAFYGTLKI